MRRAWFNASSVKQFGMLFFAMTKGCTVRGSVSGPILWLIRASGKPKARPGMVSQATNSPSLAPPVLVLAIRNSDL